MSKKRAMDAVAAARDVHLEAYQKLTKVIARKRLLRQSVSKEQLLRATVSRRYSTYSRKLLELKAASVVVNAPSPGEVARVRGYITKIRNLAVADAARAAGLKAIKDALVDSAGVAAKPRVA